MLMPISLLGGGLLGQIPLTPSTHTTAMTTHLTNIPAWMVVASLCGAGFSTLTWWITVTKPGKKAPTNGRLAAMFALAAIPAPFLALGGHEIINRQFPWTRETPFLELLGAFLLGVGAPVIVPKLVERVVAKASAEDLK